MAMTNTEKYNTLILEIGELLREKNQTISIRDWQLGDVNKKLATAEERIQELEKENAFLEEALRDAEEEIASYQQNRIPILELEHLGMNRGGDGEC